MARPNWPRAPSVPPRHPRAVAAWERAGSALHGAARSGAARRSSLLGSPARLPERLKLHCCPGSDSAQIHSRTWGLPQPCSNPQHRVSRGRGRGRGRKVTWHGPEAVRLCGGAGSGARRYNPSWRRQQQQLGCGAAATELRAWRACAEPRPGLRVPPGLCTPDAARVLSPPRLGRW